LVGVAKVTYFFNLKNEKSVFSSFEKKINIHAIYTVKKVFRIFGVKKNPYICSPFKKFSINSLNRYKDDESRNRY